MGETGCGKTKLIEFMSKLQVPTALKKDVNTMIIVKVILVIDQLTTFKGKRQ